MKNFIMLIIGVLYFGFQSKADMVYQPILEEGKSWVISGTKLDDEIRKWVPVTIYTASVQGRTEIDGEEVWIVRQEFTSKENTVDSDILLKEKDKRLYYFDDAWLNEWILLLDFNYTAGDVNIPVYCYDVPLDDTSVVEEGTLMIEGIERRFLKLERDEYWIEGIGSPQLFYINNMAVPIHMFRDRHIAECHLDGNCIFNYDEFQRISGVQETEFSETDSTQILDLNGLPISNPQVGSIYIRGGKKFVAK